MATQVLNPHDYFIIPQPPSFSRRCNYYGYNNRTTTSRSHRKHVARPDLRKRNDKSSFQLETASVSKRSSADDSATGKSSSSPVEKVTILRRGQSLDSSLVAAKNDMYAGSAFAMSPSPSALPLPSFMTKKQSLETFDDSATRDLRRLLRID
ncbi:uncharacterized protein [Cicer arietinum]|uniref:Uncharacterized protein LOC101512024 n=1 Tax=Cicer arietinum TaxID=3827 RepID=A0A1S2YQF9_CICAR|nr:uncharacterized protein LOC101512024 [Cicer arietinum]